MGKVLRFDGIPEGRCWFYQRNDVHGEIKAEPGHEVELDKVLNPEIHIAHRFASIHDAPQGAPADRYSAARKEVADALAEGKTVDDE